MNNLKQFQRNLENKGCGYSSICENYPDDCDCGIIQTIYDAETWKCLLYGYYPESYEEDYNYRY